MRTLTVIVAGLLSLAALVGFGVSADETAAREGGAREPLQGGRAVPTTDANLELFEQRSEGRAAGSYRDAGSVVSFGSRAATPNATRARAMRTRGADRTPFTTARVVVNGKAYAWSSPGPDEKVHGPEEPLTAADARVLEKAADATWRSLERDAPKEEWPYEQLWLAGTLSYLADARVGHVFDYVEGNEEAGAASTAAADAETDLRAADLTVCRAAALERGDFAALRACSRGD